MRYFLSTLEGERMSNTGRFYVRTKSGRLFLVEPIGKPRTEFGASLTDFCNGSIREEESIITTENGFSNIGYAQNPLDYIDAIERGEKPKNDKY